jgi:hypothetical protein
MHFSMAYISDRFFEKPPLSYVSNPPSLSLITELIWHDNLWGWPHLQVSGQNCEFIHERIILSINQTREKFIVRSEVHALCFLVVS